MDTPKKKAGRPKLNRAPIKSRRTLVSLPKNVYKACKVAAERDMRSVAAQIAYMLVRHGYTTAKIWPPTNEDVEIPKEDIWNK